MEPAPRLTLFEIVFQHPRRDRGVVAWVADSMRAVLAHDDLPDAGRALVAEVLKLSELHQ